MALPQGTIIFTNGDGSDLIFRDYTGAAVSGPTVAPGSASSYDFNIVANPIDGGYFTLSETPDDPFYMGEAWDLDWNHLGGDGYPPGGTYKGGLCTLLNTAGYYAQGNPTDANADEPSNWVASIFEFNASGTIVRELNYTALLPVLTGFPNVTFCNAASIGVSPDETKAYLSTKGGANLGTGIRVWNLDSDTYGGELIADPFGHGISDRLGLTVLQDGSIVVGWSGGGGGGTGSLRRYSAAGALLNTYTSLPDDSLADYYVTPSQPGFFNVVYYDTTFFNYNWARINASTGAVTHGPWVVPASNNGQFHCEVLFGESPSPSPSPAPPVIAISTSTTSCAEDAPPTGLGPVLPQIAGTITLTCAGGGDVPSAEDATDSESWVS